MSKAVLLVDHGSRRKSAHEELMSAGEKLAQQLQERGSALLVEVAHMEIASPSILEGVERCVQAGADTIFVVPCFLSRGRHVTEDVPRLVFEAAAKYPALQVQMSPPLLDLLGFIPMLAEHVVESMAEPT